MQHFLDFVFLKDPNVRWVVLAVMLMCASSALVGCFSFLRKRALVGDAVSHAILPGICLAFLLTGTKHPLYLLMGAIATGWLSLAVIDWIVSQTRLKPDAALGLVLSVFYGIGVLLLTTIQSSGNAAQSGLDKFLFGKAAAMVWEDALTFGGFSLVLLLVVGILYAPLKLMVFDREFAIAKGLAINRLEFVLSLLTVCAIAIGIQAVGVVLMAALLITPAAAARYWTNHLSSMLGIAMLISVISGVGGAYVSFTYAHMPTGPWIVTILSLMAIVSVMLGTEKGAVHRWMRSSKNTEKMLLENVLKTIYHLGEEAGDFYAGWTLGQIQQKRTFNAQQLAKALNILQKKGWLHSQSGVVKFTEAGWEEGKKVIRRHRLWELYLSRVLQLPADHVHDDAEAIEHILTPELEMELLQKLDFPTSDPHDEPIPR